MSEHDDRLPMLQMLEHAREAASHVSTRRREDLDADRLLRLALERLVEIVGEAANRVSAATQQRLVRVPWREAVSMRHRVSHGYDTVDYDLLWDTIRDDFPPLIAALDDALNEAKKPTTDRSLASAVPDRLQAAIRPCRRLPSRAGGCRR